MTEFAVSRYPTPPVIRGANVTAKAGLVVLLAFAITFPDLSNLRDKAAGMRAIGYPMLAFTVPLVWFLFWRERASFPWLADLLVTITCFSDILGNQMNLYSTIVWFDDWMHFMNTGLLAAAAILLTLRRSASFGAVLERALAFGATAAIGWELAEFFAFLRFSPERRNGYSDTLGDLSLGVLGAAFAAVVVHALWRRGRLESAAPQLDIMGRRTG
jgi:hypothetical protein